MGTKEKDESVKGVKEVSAVEQDGEDQAIYSCPESGCTRVFQRHSALEKHLSSEKCTRSLERHTLADLAKLGYKQMLEEGVGVVPTLQTSSASHKNQGGSVLIEGWALRSTKKSYRFNEKQKAYLLAKFQIGQATGRKANADAVAREMRRAHGKDGVRLFPVSEFLTAQQIASYFSRLAATVRQQTPSELDILAGEEEQNFETARDTILSSMNLQHPITYDHYNVCAMVEDDTMKSLKLPFLQLMCQSLGLDVPQPPVRRKAPYLSLLKEVVSNCSCQR